MSAHVPPPNTPEWEAWRDGGVGASEVPALLGEDRWITERGLALEKRRLVPHHAPTTAMDWGHRVEALGASLYEERTGRTLEEPGTLIHPRWQHVFATPDRRAGDRLVELKWTNRWSEPPRRVVIQCQVQMAVAVAAVVDVVVMGPYGEPRFHEIERDERDGFALCDWAEEWYERYVLGDELPPLDGSDETRRHLDSLGGTGTMRATDEQSRLMAALRAARRDKAGAEEDEARIRNLLVASMAGMERVDGPGWHITWKSYKGRTTTVWKDVAMGLAKGRGRLLKSLLAAHTSIGGSSRPFTPHWEEED